MEQIKLFLSHSRKLNKAIISPQYLAGFIDGEGYIGISFHKIRIKGKPEYTQIRTRITITNTDIKIMNMAHEYIKHLGCHATMRATQQRPNWKIRYQIEIEQMKSVRILLDHIIDFLIVKRDKAEMILKYLDHRMKRIKLTRGRNKYLISDIQMANEIRNMN